MPDVIERSDLANRIRRELDAIKDPCSLASGVPLGLDEMGIVDTVDVAADGAVEVRLRLIGFFKVEADRLVGAIPGVTSVAVKADNGLDWSPSRISLAGQAKRAVRLDTMQAAAIAR